MPHRASHWIWSCRNLMRMEVHLESVLSPTPTPHPSPHPSFSDCSKKCHRNYLKKHEQIKQIWSQNSEKWEQNGAETEPNQAKRSPRQSCGAKGRILAALGVTWGRLGRSFAPLGVALVDLLLLLGSLWTPFFDVGGFWMGLEAQPMHFWSIFGAILHQKALKKQCQNKFYSEFEKPWFLRHVCSKNVILEVVRASKIKKNTLKIHEKSSFKQVV